MASTRSPRPTSTPSAATVQTRMAVVRFAFLEDDAGTDETDARHDLGDDTAVVDAATERGIGEQIGTDDQDDGRSLPHRLARFVPLVSDHPADQDGQEQIEREHQQVRKVEGFFKEVCQNGTLSSLKYG